MDYREMTKEDLVRVIDGQEQQILELTIKLESKQSGRKSQVLDILKSHSPITIVAISERLGISTKNVSSQLTYLRQDGFNICTNVNGKKFLVS